MKSNIPSPTKLAASNKGCMIFFLSGIMMIFLAGAVLLMKQLKTEHPALFWTIVCAVGVILTGVAVWGVGRVIKRRKQRASE